MKKKILALLLTLTALLCAVPAAAEGETAPAEVTVSTNAADLKLKDNKNKNYIAGIGMNHSPAESFLCANEEGGVTLVQYIHAQRHVAVAEFDAQLNFLNCRYLPVDEDIKTWGGFCAGAEHYYIAYRVWSPISSAILRVEQYDRDWTLVKAGEIVCSGAGSIISNDFDMVESGGLLHIITNQVFGSGSGKGHQANMHLEVSTSTLEKSMQHIGVGTYPGYLSHSYMPEVVASGGKLYTFDRSDTYPTPGLYVTAFGGSFSSGGAMTGPYAWGGDWRDWGNLGNAIAAPGGQALLAYNAGTYFINSIPDNCEVYLYHTGSGAKKVSGSYGAGTPYVAAASGTSGYVLWNPDLYGDEPKDDLYYAPYVISGGSLSVGTVLKAEGHYLSDCEPITFDGGLLWFSVEDGELVFHQLKMNKAPTKTIAHRYAPVERVEPTCTKPGQTAGTKCVLCGEIGEGLEEIPALPHTEESLPAREATCGLVGLTEGKQCSVCGTITVEQQEIPGPPHTEEIIPGWEATCAQKGRTEGRRCTVCGQTTVQYQYTDKLPHTEVVRPGYAPSCINEGRTDGTKCGVCGLILDNGEPIPKVDHTVVDTPEVPPTVALDGKTAGTACEVCKQQFTGGEPIPKTLFVISGQEVREGKLLLRYGRNRNYVVVFTLWDGQGRLLDVKLANNSINWWAYDLITFDLTPEAVSYKAFALMNEGNLFAPVCDVREGLIEYPAETA